MKRIRHYIFEIALIAAVIVISIAGFWNIYFGAEADPQPHHHLHFATAFIWMGLLLAQLILIVRRSYQMHRKVGLAVLIAGPLLVATTAMLAVRSAHKGMVSGEGDFMIIQNTMATLELGLLIFLAFLLKNRRKLHGSLLLSTTILFMGIALFFALTSFVPPFRTESFDPTFDGFRLAGNAGQITRGNHPLQPALADHQRNAALVGQMFNRLAHRIGRFQGHTGGLHDMVDPEEQSPPELAARVEARKGLAREPLLLQERHRQRIA